MSNLTSTVPGAFNALYSLVVAAGASQSPAVPVFHTELVQLEPPIYVLLTGVENHQFQPAAIGSYAQWETYDITGTATVLQGDVDPQTVLNATWGVYQQVVMTPIVANRGQPGPVLGTQAPDGLEWIIPGYARYMGQPGQFGDGAGGFAGRVEFSYSLKARITVP